MSAGKFGDLDLQLKHAMVWNRLDVAKTALKKHLAAEQASGNTDVRLILNKTK